ncbi:MAG TPA: hypothetical protein VIT24_04310 [Acidimicrobiales bacterium]
MTLSRTLWAAVLGALVGCLAVAGMVGSAFSAPAPEAQAVHRAAIVVDTGSGVVSRCVTFSEDSISGITALQRAGLAPVVRSFSGTGGAVCGLNGLGCPADSSCLTCQAPNYWAYYRADNGANGFSYSQVGAGSTQVTDGDVEGWRWGSGAAPAFRSFGSICPLQPPLTTTTTTTTAPRPDGSDNGNGSTGNPDGAPGPGGTPGSASDDTPPGASQTTVVPTTTAVGEGRTAPGGQDSDPTDGDSAAAVDGEDAAARTPLDEDGSGAGARTWVAFVALLGGFGLAGWRIHRVRRSG